MIKKLQNTCDVLFSPETFAIVTRNILLRRDAVNPSHNVPKSEMNFAVEHAEERFRERVRTRRDLLKGISCDG